MFSAMTPLVVHKCSAVVMQNNLKEMGLSERHGRYAYKSAKLGIYTSDEASAANTRAESRKV
jgi:hypothetical protein